MLVTEAVGQSLGKRLVTTLLSFLKSCPSLTLSILFKACPISVFHSDFNLSLLNAIQSKPDLIFQVLHMLSTLKKFFNEKETFFGAFYCTTDLCRCILADHVLHNRMNF